MSILANAFKRLGTLIATPLLYGFSKLQKSLSNLFSWYKPGRSFLRAATTATGTYWGCYFGAVSGAAAGSIVPVVGNIIGGIIGGVLGALIGSSVAAFLSKHILRIFSTINESEKNEKAIIENTTTNPDKYVLSNSQYKALLKAFPSNEGQAHPQRLKLESQVRAVKAKKDTLGFWSNFFWTDEYAEKQNLNKLSKKIMADPVKAVQTDVIEFGQHRFNFQPKVGANADDNNSLDWVHTPRISAAAA